MLWKCRLQYSLRTGRYQQDTRRLCLLLCITVTCVAISMSLPMVGLAQQLGSIRGLVQHNGQSVPEHRIMLIRFGPHQDVQRTPGQTDAQGRFVFEQLETGETFTYVVGIRYAEQLYRSEAITLEPGQDRTDIVVEIASVDAQTESEMPARMHIANHLKVVVLRDDHLEVREVIRLLNPPVPSTTDLASPSMAEGFSLHLPLSQGYTNFRDLQGLTAEHVRLLTSGIYYTAPLPAGEHRVVYTYALPFRTSVTTLLAERSLPTAVFDVLIQDEHLVASSDLAFGGQVAIAPHTFWHFRGTDLPAHTRSWLQLTRQSASIPYVRIVTYILIIGLALLGVGLPLYRPKARQIQQAEPRTSVSREHMQALNATRLRLLQAIARLDDQYASGALSEEDYRQQRQPYKTRLLKLFDELHNVQQDKDNGMT